MTWKLDKNRPVCPQICEMLCVSVTNGTYGPEERLPSVREIATGLGVNPNTVQRALETLEEQELLYSVRGSGWYVGQDIHRAREVLERMRRDKATAFFAEMEMLGMTPDEVKAFIKTYEKE